ncbi:MAG TPA: hypothetical protein VLC09_08165 [Polyangiaceae bacterium]|nr:hypothetical protein [Polyangiaceae bacterium]
MSSRRSQRLGWLCVVGALSACEPTPPANTGGVELEEIFGPSGESCGRGVVVVLSDYQSTSVAVLDLEGTTRSGTFVSSGSTQTTLNGPLSGDVVLPSGPLDDEMVLLDRYPGAILDYLEWETAEVRGQLDVGTEFASNPQDYLRLDEDRALVSRFAANPDPEASELDRGDDLLVVDPVGLRVLSSVDLSAFRSPGYLARPSTLLRVDDTVIVAFSGHSGDFEDAAEGRLGLFDAETLEAVGDVRIDGWKNCLGLALSPSGDELAVSCSGLIDGADEPAPPDGGLIRFVIQRGGAGLTLEESQRHPAADWALGPLGPGLAYASDGALFFSTYGAVEGADAGRADTIQWLDVASGEIRTVLESDPDPFTLGAMACRPGCGVCFFADAGRHVVHRLELDGVDSPSPVAIEIDEATGLPPRALGLF